MLGHLPFRGDSSEHALSDRPPSVKGVSQLHLNQSASGYELSDTSDLYRECKIIDEGAVVVIAQLAMIVLADPTGRLKSYMYAKQDALDFLDSLLQPLPSLMSLSMLSHIGNLNDTSSFRARTSSDFIRHDDRAVAMIEDSRKVVSTLPSGRACGTQRQ